MIYPLKNRKPRGIIYAFAMERKWGSVHRESGITIVARDLSKYIVWTKVFNLIGPKFLFDSC